MKRVLTAFVLFGAACATALAVSQSPVPSWGLDRIDQRDLPLDNTYSYESNGANVHVYVFDTGILATHTEFTGRIGNGYDAIGNDTTPEDAVGHGTHVAGTIGGSIVGVAKGVTIHAVRMESEVGATPEDMVQGVEWIVDNLQLPAVVNMSNKASSDFSVDEEAAYRDAVAELVAAGAVVIASAGNDNADACGQLPARFPGVIAVGATDINDQRYESSNWGSCVDLFAPGVEIYSAERTGNSAYGLRTGTSMAAPHVSGVAATYLQTHPAATVEEVKQALISYATTGKITEPATGLPMTSSANVLLYSQLPVPPTLSFSQPIYGSLENFGASATFTVKRSGNLSGQVTVQCAVSSGSAIAGVDIGTTSTPATLVWPDGIGGNKTCSFQKNGPYNDSIPEPDEYFFVNLTNPTGGVSLSMPYTAQVNIPCNDGYSCP